MNLSTIKRFSELYPEIRCTLLSNGKIEIFNVEDNSPISIEDMAAALEVPPNTMYSVLKTLALAKAKELENLDAESN